MTALVLPTYACLVPDSVYGRDANIIFSEDDTIAATQIARLSRFVVSSRDEVLGHIQTMAQGIPLEGPESEPQDDDSDLVYSLKMLPSDAIPDIAQGEERTIHLLQRLYSPHQLQPGRAYLLFSSDLVPQEAFSVLKKYWEEQGKAEGEALVYEIAIDESRAAFGAKTQSWDVLIRLAENGAFPEHSELEYLLAREVRDSAVIRLGGASNNYPAVVEHMGYLSAALPSSESLAQVNDRSPAYLEESAAAIINNIQSLRVAGEITRKIFGSSQDAFQQDAAATPPLDPADKKRWN
ncbi:MAG: hypothetical protein Q8R53_04940 [Nanoarchaeota archaeon]|nr:hypothetical protein [Nanoarchaeota archaeon]